MTDEPKRLTDSQLAEILAEVDPKERETRRSCPLCEQGMVTLCTARAYSAMLQMLRHSNDRAIDLVTDPKEDDEQ